MRLVTYRSADTWKPGVLRGEYIIDLNEVLRAADLLDRPEHASVREFLEASAEDLAFVSARVQAVEAEKLTAIGHLSEIVLAPPVPDPSKVLCVGLNYSDHVGETGRKFPEFPDIFSKFDSSLIGSFAPIDCAAVTDNLDFEGELAIVIGRHAHHVAESDAMNYVAGVTVLNDITARDLQYRGTQWLPGKAVDGSTPCGPALVTLDEVGDPQHLDITTRVNGVQVQGSNTEKMIFPLARIVSYISSFLALSPGDIIATGTPEGIGAKRTPPQWLQAGDTVEVEIETVGLLSNVVK
ncbi:fumarylacetoacetate hydrolase family protein [Rhodococcus fascians]|nr:fumarylacetoacetate hydrolase family protein [Rhodococcus fascians]MBY3825742.1 fumarylacetoacetate hydrolase family protein [Rhodococcus fascians]MBY3836204.1 fumarylacetoacetate hydrolase family protein [Rhodococcus fascians]MBY3866388.1 fumarylacetoacetate hydrolase family protein [Rhodococcus fascians]MBY3884886.1 fumarylacetoacetate hydrolase family protein [Rhodococcus fascians]